MSGENMVRGVISGIPISVTTDQINRNVEGANVKKAKQLKTLSVMLEFDKEKLPSEVFVG